MEKKKQTENLLMLNPIIPKACKKWPRNGKIQGYKKNLLLTFVKFWILNFVVINIERFDKQFDKKFEKMAYKNNKINDEKRLIELTKKVFKKEFAQQENNISNLIRGNFSITK